MKKIVFILSMLFSLAAQASGGYYTSTGRVDVYPCATGYTRIAPGHCLADTQTAIALSTTCSAIANPWPFAKAIEVMTSVRAIAVGSPGNRSTRGELSTNASCTAPFIGAYANGFEITGYSVGQPVGSDTTNTIVPTAGGSLFIRMTNSGSGDGFYSVVGYFD